jgi:hypothetical protein
MSSARVATFERDELQLQPSDIIIEPHSMIRPKRIGNAVDIGNFPSNLSAISSLRSDSS